jgi:ADP-heptose:LPS heptosyltransferase
MQMLKEVHPTCHLTYFCGSRTQELWERFPFVDSGFVALGLLPSELGELAIRSGTFDWVINIESADWARFFAAAISSTNTFVTGAAWSEDSRGELPFEETPQGQLWQDKRWIREDICLDYPFLQSSFIGEMFCRLAYLPGEVPKYRLPSALPNRDVPDVLIAMSASLESKLWTENAWLSVTKSLADSGRTIGLLGAKRSSQGRYWQGMAAEDAVANSGWVIDLRGEFTMPEVVGAIQQADLVLTLDNGIMHMAAATDTKCISLFRYGIHRLWTPPIPSIFPVVASEGCHVSSIPVQAVLEVVEAATRPCIN